MDAITTIFRMSMNKTVKIIGVLIFSLFLSCQNKEININNNRDLKSERHVNGSHNLIESDVHKEKKSIPVNDFLPDSSINNKLFLDNYRSINNLITPNEIKYITHIRNSPVILFINKDNSEYLLAYQYEGATKYSFDCFEIGYRKEFPNFKGYETNENHFFTESGLRLGISLQELEKIKGRNFMKEIKNYETIIYYYLSGNHPFVRRYHMPGYFMKFFLRENKVVKIIFGFEYP